MFEECVNIDEFIEEKECDYKGEHYSVRDNGAIMRHANNERKRPNDEKWTFGKKDNTNGYMLFGGERVHIIVATAFHGEHDSKVYVVDHIDTNRCNNRPDNLRWLTRLENVLNNPVTRKRIEYLCGGDLPIKDYFDSLKVGEIFVTASYGSSLIFEFTLYKDKILVITKIPNGVKNFALTEIEWNGEVFIHKSHGTFFDENGVRASYTQLQDQEWTGGDSIDFYC